MLIYISQVLPLNFTSFLTASFGGVVHSAYFHFQVAAGVPEQSPLVYSFHSKSSPAHDGARAEVKCRDDARRPSVATARAPRATPRCKPARHMQPCAASQRTVAYEHLTRIRIAVTGVCIALVESRVWVAAGEGLSAETTLRGRGALAR